MTAWTDLIGWTLLHFLWQGTLISCGTAIALRMLRQVTAHVRYAAGCVALLVTLAAPLVTGLTLVSRGALGFAPSPQVAAAVPLLNTLAGSRTTTPDNPSGAGVIPRAIASPDARAGLRGVLPWVVWFWATGVFLLNLRLMLGWWQVRRLHAEALSTAPSTWLASAARIAEQLGLARAIHVVDSSRVETPTVVGWLRPVVLLPAAVLTNLSPGQVQAILAHELAHIRRHDFVVNLLQAVAETVLFYHPGVWWLSARVRAEREHCCDDIAVDVCGDPVDYAQALTALATWAHGREREGSPALALAATGGSLLVRVRRLLRMPADTERRRPRAPIVIAAAVVLIAAAGTRLMLVAQVPGAVHEGREDGRIGPMEVNRLLGFDLFPGPIRYATDDPAGARAWDVAVAYPGGEMPFVGFTGRSLVRYAHGLDGDTPVLGGPDWLDRSMRTIRGETSAPAPSEQDFRDAIRLALESQYRLAIRQETRLVPVYALQVVETGRLGPHLRPSTAECFESGRDRLATIGPTLRARGQQMQFCGMEAGITGKRGYRVTLAEFARSLRGFQMEQGTVELAREVIDQTGLAGVYDLELNLGFLPAAVVAAVHFQAARLLWPLGVRTFPQAIQEQLGLRLVPTEVPRDVIMIEMARQQLHAKAEDVGRLFGVASSAR